MAGKKRPPGDYEVGYGKPPKRHQFPKGRSGNVSGRPKSKKPGLTDISGLLNEPVKLKAGDKVREMAPFEAGLRKLAKRAVDKDLRAILKFVKICEEYGVFAPPSADTSCGVVRAPKGVNFHEWLESVTEEVPIYEA
jgi:hypothetical protein